MPTPSPTLAPVDKPEGGGGMLVLFVLVLFAAVTPLVDELLTEVVD